MKHHSFKNYYLHPVLRHTAENLKKKTQKLNISAIQYLIPMIAIEGKKKKRQKIATLITSFYLNFSLLPPKSNKFMSFYLLIQDLHFHLNCNKLQIRGHKNT